MKNRAAADAGITTTGPSPFGARLRTLRLAAGLSQELLAAASGLSSHTISELESGRRAVPHAASARLLADALQLDQDERAEFFKDIRRSRSARMSSRPVAAQLAAPLPPILGRSAEIAAVEDLFARGERLVTLVGPGGVGKTRLARSVASRAADAGLPVLWVALESVSVADLVLPAIARTANAASRGSEPPLATLIRAFADDPPLLALDNVEHLLAAAPELAALLEAAPGLRILATSREALRIGPERLIRVDPLPVPSAGDEGDALAANPAVALFMRSLAASAPPHMRDAATIQDAASVVRMLEGLPLAVELAAAQGATLPIATIASLLETTGLAVLKRGRRDTPARFHTMDSAIGWSVDLLPPDAQQLFRLLGVFRGGITIDAALGVAAEAGQPDLIAALPILAEAHLIDHDPALPGGRARMLEPIRLAALDRLRAAGEAPAARRAHAAWFHRWAQAQASRVAGPDPLPALDALDADLANLLSAIEFSVTSDPGQVAMALGTAADLSQFWELRTRFREGRAALETAIAAAIACSCAESCCRQELMEALFYKGYLAYTQGDVNELEQGIDGLRPQALTADSPEYLARLGILEILRDELHGVPIDQLLPHAQATHLMVEDGPQEKSWYLSLALLANVMVENGDLEDALPRLQAAAKWAERRRNSVHASTVTACLGWLQLQRGQYDDARQAFTDALLGSAGKPVVSSVWSRIGVAIAISSPAATDADMVRAALLHGTFDADAARYGYRLSVVQARLHGESRERIANRLGQERFAALLAEGSLVADDDQVDLIRSLPRPHPAPMSPVAGS